MDLSWESSTGSCPVKALPVRVEVVVLMMSVLPVPALWLMSLKSAVCYRVADAVKSFTRCSVELFRVFFGICKGISAVFFFLLQSSPHQEARVEMHLCCCSTPLRWSDVAPSCDLCHAAFSASEVHTRCSARLPVCPSPCKPPRKFFHDPLQAVTGFNAVQMAHNAVGAIPTRVLDELQCSSDLVSLGHLHGLARWQLLCCQRCLLSWRSSQKHDRQHSLALHPRRLLQPGECMLPRS